MAEADRKSDAGPIEAGQPGGGAAAADSVPMPTPLDALARELLAIRSLAASLLAMTDAALTSHRLAALGAASRETIEIRGAARDLAAVIRSATARPGDGVKVPRMFNDRTRAVDNDVQHDSQDVIVPPIGGGTA